MSIWKTKRFQRFVALILAFASLITHLTFGAYAELTDTLTSSDTEGDYISIGTGKSQYAQIMTADNLEEIFELLMADIDATCEFSMAELTAIKSKVGNIYASLNPPTQDEQEYYEMIMDTIAQLMGEEESSETMVEPAAGTLYFDLSLGNVNIDASTYSGKVYVKNGDAYTVKTLAGTHNENNVYYVYQSNGDTNRGYVTMEDGVITNVVLPEYTAIENWGESIKNNYNAKAVADDWVTKAAATGRAPVEYYIRIIGSGNYNLVIDNVWSDYCVTEASANSKYGSIIVDPRKNSQTTITFKGNNRLHDIYYSTSKAAQSDVEDPRLFIGGATDNDTLTVIDGSGISYRAVIGSNDAYDEIFGLNFTKGYVYAGAYSTANTTAIGGGGNGNADIVISGGVVTAVGYGVGAGIGGGCGNSGIGGYGNVRISGGEVYARSNGNGAAIGGGGSNQATSGDGNVIIYGGKVDAFNSGSGKRYGGGIGGGGTAAKTSVVVYEGATVENADYKALSSAGFYEGETKLFTLYADGTATPHLGDEMCCYVDSAGNGWTGTITADKYYIYAFTPQDNTVYFDLALSGVKIENGFCSGQIYLNHNGNNTPVFIYVRHKQGLKYYVFQSSTSYTAYTGYMRVTDGAATVKKPEYSPITVEDKSWGEYIKNRQDVRNVASEWDNKAVDNGRTSTENYVYIHDSSYYEITIQDVWSVKNEKNAMRSTGGVSYSPLTFCGGVNLIFLGNNRLCNVYYSTLRDRGGIVVNTSLTIGGKNSEDSLTVIANKDGNNLYTSVIGSSDTFSCEDTINLFFTNGYIYAGATEQDYCTAIGAGANGKASVGIFGGVVTAVSTGNSAAIGSGYTGSSRSDASNISISGNAVVYAYHDGGKGAAIGGAGSDGGTLGDVTVNISGNATVNATNQNGMAIGAGISRGGAPACTITIDGGSVTATNNSGCSIGGTGGGATFVSVAAPGSLNCTYSGLNSVKYRVEDADVYTFYCNDNKTPEIAPPDTDGYFLGWFTESGAEWSETISAKDTVYVAYIVAAKNNKKVYFDLALGDVRVEDGYYSGKIYDQNSQKVYTIYGPHSDNNEYYVYQSTESNLASTGIAVDGEVKMPEYTPVVYDGKDWAEFITNNSSVESVIDAWSWIKSSEFQGRKYTLNQIYFNGSQNYNLFICDLWVGLDLEPEYSYVEINNVGVSSGTHVRGSGTYKDRSCLVYVPKGQSKMSLTFVGDNRLDSILYRNSTSANALSIQGAKKSDTLTVAATKPGANWWCSAIGGCDDQDAVYNLSINKGTVFAGTTRMDNATAIGGGGNGYGQVTITGNDTVVTAVASTTGATIGGGIGQHSKGGEGNVTIEGGEVYAYNHGLCLSLDGLLYAIPSVAIGGGSSVKSSGSDATVVISGGTVYAQSVHGAAIGGGGSTTKNAGSATVVISGGTVVAISKSGPIYGTIQYDSKENCYDRHLDKAAGASIGGGTGALNGGYADLAISGENTEVKTGSIGGGNCTGKGPLGYARVTITGGYVQGQVIMEETGKAGDYCTFAMTGGILNNIFHQEDEEQDNTFTDGEYVYYFVENNGGAVCMKDSHGMTFVSGNAEIRNCRGANGGAIYMTGGSFNMSDGVIKDCFATNEGGAVYLGGGVVEFQGGALLNNVAGTNGGAVAVNNGQIVMSGGTVSENKAETGFGGGYYVSAPAGKAVAVKVFSGTLSENTAAISGGAVAVNGLENCNITVQIGVNKNHFDHEGNLLPSFVHEEIEGTYTHYSCPKIENNSATVSGGAFFIKAPNDSETNLNIYCSVDESNTAEEDVDSIQNDRQLSSFLMVEGGRVIISTAEDYTNVGENPELGDDKHGYLHIKGTVHIVSGELELFGSMDNPSFDGYITIDLQKKEDKYMDHRVSEDKVKISYHENFKDADGVPDSTQTAFDVDSGSERQLETGLYAHPGYELFGWNTNPDAVPNTTLDGWYEPGLKLTFYNASEDYTTDLENGIQSGDLTLYAIWKINGYTISFDPGVKDNDEWWGSVPSISCSYAAKVNLRNNGYVYPGYIFDGWKLDDTIYPEGAEVSKLSTVNADTVTFVAQWKECPHDGGITFSINDAQDTITRTCTTCKLSATAKLTAQDAVYNGNSHSAFLECSNPGFWTPVVYYYVGDNDAAKTEVAPVNAGEYKAMIIGGEEKVIVPFTISKATQTAPTEIPVYTYVHNNPGEHSLIINQIPVRQNPKSGAFVEYVVVYYENDKRKEEILTGKDQGDTISFPLKVEWTTYSVYARYSETENYYASEMVSAKMTFFFDGGRVKLNVDADEGIEFALYVDKANEGQLTLAASLKDGYYLVNGDYELICDKNNVVTIVESKTGDYTITAQSDVNVEVTIHIGTTKKQASITSTLKEKEHFDDFTSSNSVNIANDSAFTVQYTVVGYDKSDYGNLSLEFDKALPEGTTIILRNRNDKTYWYYKVRTGEIKIIPLEDFKKMGDTTKQVKLEFDKGDLKLQFIVNFSKAVSRLSDNLTCKLNVPKLDSADEKATDLLNAAGATVSVNLSSVNVSLSTVNDNTQHLQISIEIGDGVAASKYDNRDIALILSVVDGTVLPPDAAITVTNNGVNVTYRMNNTGTFIIPLGDFRKMEEELIQFELVSDMFLFQETTYKLKASLRLSMSNAESASLNGVQLSEEKDISFVIVRDSVGICVFEENDKRIYTNAEDSKITVTVVTAPEILPNKYMITVQLHEELEGVYGNTALHHSNNGNKYTFTLDGCHVGNYCVVATISDAVSGYVVAESRYYIIIKPGN